MLLLLVFRFEVSFGFCIFGDGFRSLFLNAMVCPILGLRGCVGVGEAAVLVGGGFTDGVFRSLFCL